MKTTQFPINLLTILGKSCINSSIKYNTTLHQVNRNSTAKEGKILYFGLYR